MEAVERGQALRALRNNAGLTAVQVAAEFGISKQAVGEWESGKSRPDVMKLRKLDKLYAAGGKVLELFDLADDAATRLDALETEVQSLRQAVTLLQAHLKMDVGREPPATGADEGADVAPPSSP